MEALSGAMQRRAGELSASTEAALTKVAAWDQHVRSHAEVLRQTTVQATQNAEEAARLMDDRTNEMRKTSNETRTLFEHLKDQWGKTATFDPILAP